MRPHAAGRQMSRKPIRTMMKRMKDQPLLIEAEASQFGHLQMHPHLHSYVDASRGGWFILTPAVNSSRKHCSWKGATDWQP
jgi:hypothetical protein